VGPTAAARARQPRLGLPRLGRPPTVRDAETPRPATHHVPCGGGADSAPAGTVAAGDVARPGGVAGGPARPHPPAGAPHRPPTRRPTMEAAGRARGAAAHGHTRSLPRRGGRRCKRRCVGPRSGRATRGGERGGVQGSATERYAAVSHHRERFRGRVSHTVIAQLYCCVLHHRTQSSLDHEAPGCIAPCYIRTQVSGGRPVLASITSWSGGIGRDQTRHD